MSTYLRTVKVNDPRWPYPEPGDVFNFRCEECGQHCDVVLRITHPETEWPCPRCGHVYIHRHPTPPLVPELVPAHETPARLSFEGIPKDTRPKFYT